MWKGKKITTQAQLANVLGVRPDTLCKGKMIKGYLSNERYAKLAEITGIPYELWASGSRRTLFVELREFFNYQKGRK